MEGRRVEGAKVGNAMEAVKRINGKGKNRTPNLVGVQKTEPAQGGGQGEAG
jgi:hypothetical protein